MKTAQKIKKEFKDQKVITKGVLLAFLFILLGVLFSFLFDTSIFQIIFQFKSAEDSFFRSLTDSFFRLMSSYYVLLVVLYVFPCIYLLRDKRRNYIPFIAGSLALSIAFSQLLKLDIERIRPFLALDLTSLVLERSFSFPSNHATIAFAAIPIYFWLFKRLKIWAFLLALFISFSRIYLGVHYLSDVLAGAFIGLVIGYVWLYFKDRQVDVFSTEMKRQTMHIIWGSLLVLLLYLGFIDILWVIAFLLLGLILSFILTKKNVVVISWFLKNFDRHDKIPGFGAITFGVGILLSILLFSSPITEVSRVALASIMVLTFGDSAATLAGKLYGKHKNPLNKKKTVEGTVIGMVVGSLAAMVFLPWYLAVPAAVVAMLVEAVEGKFFKLSDNITVPLVFGIVVNIVNSIL